MASNGAESGRKTNEQGIKTYNASSTYQYFNVDDPNSIQKLREMAERGEFPQFIESQTREARERFYEEFNKLYPDPPGILNDYRIEQEGSRRINILFNYNMAEAESPPPVVLPKKNSSEAVRNGAIKYAIYAQRPAVENALLVRKGGYSSYELAAKYGKRVLSAKEKAEADREMISFVEKLMKSPLSKEGHLYNQEAWKKQGNGWVRAGASDIEGFKF